jgi:hypothetical protein
MRVEREATAFPPLDAQLVSGQPEGDTIRRPARRPPSVHFLTRMARHRGSSARSFPSESAGYAGFRDTGSFLTSWQASCITDRVGTLDEGMMVMLDPWIIEEIRRREQEQRQEQDRRSRLEIHIETPADRDRSGGRDRERDRERPSDRGVTIIDYTIA